ncbi:MAG: hypothetical protein KAT34_05965 [Candidatus Aminicenantes bacterium]|nr:hypothetical protein [Candidatus Aminicenantes bacterium]
MKTKFKHSIILILFLAVLPISRLSGETVSIPGDVNAISFYTKFFYNLPADDFLYYLNDRCLFTEDPDDRLFPTGVRNQLRKIILVHKRIKQFMREINGDDSKTITINLNEKTGVEPAEELTALLGLYLEPDKDGRYQVYVDDSAGVVDYYKFAMINIDKLVRQINKTKLLHFKIIDSDIAIPWDLQYINEITGLNLDVSSFFETMVKNERLSLLLGILYRLSSLEADFFDNLVESPRLEVWKRVYRDKRLLMGLFVLAPALRVSGGSLVVPGGTEAEKFWSDLVGSNCKESPFEFLESLTTMEDGKLNYLYLFSFFLPENSRKALLCDYNPEKIQALLTAINLGKKEKLSTSRLPQLRDFSFYTLLYCLKVENGRVQIPGGIPAWLNAIKKKDSGVAAGNEKAQIFDLFVELLENSKKSGGNKMSALKKFMSIYSKFVNRPRLLSEEVIKTLYKNYEKYNILVDFIEKIPIKKPGTVLNIFKWMKTFGGVNKKDRAMFTAIFQSLLEILSHTAKYAPEKFDYDRLVCELIKLPMNNRLFCDALMQYLKNELKIKLLRENIDRSFTNFVLSGIENKSLRFNNLEYRYLAKEMYRDLIKKIQQSQEVCFLSTLIEIMDLLDEIVKYNAGTDPALGERIRETFLLLPQPDISEDAPQVIWNRVIAYSRDALEKDLKRFVEKTRSNAPKVELRKITEEIKGKYLLPHVKDFFLSFIYALNAKNPKLRFFINPNLVRLHDFDGGNGHTCWNFSGSPKSKVLEKRGTGIFGGKEIEIFSGYYLRGGLSRLNIVFAAIWKDHLFGRNVIYDPEHVKAFITNLLDFYPVPKIEKSQKFTALCVGFGLALLQKARNDENLRRDLIEELGEVTTGYHYRNIVDYVNGKAQNYYLFFNEIMALGERFFVRKKYLAEFSGAKELEAFYKPSPGKNFDSDMDQFGGIYYKTFGSLLPYRAAMFPQEVGNFFKSGWTSGEMVNEFKVKVAYHAEKKGIPPYLLGEFLYEYLDKTTRRYYSQNHKKDYFSTYFIFDIFNNSYLNKILKKSKEKGYLRIK